MSRFLIIPTLLALLVLLVILVTSIQKGNSVQRSSAANAQYSYQSTGATVSTNGNSVKVFLNTGTEPVVFAKTTIVYNPAQLQLVDNVVKSSKLVSEVTRTSTQNANSTGKLTLVATACSSTDKACFSLSAPSGTFDIATLTFKPTAGFTSGSSTVSIDTANSQVVTSSSVAISLAGQQFTLSYPTSTSTPHSTPVITTPVPTIKPTLAPTLTPSPVTSGAFSAQYFNNKTLSGTPVLTRTETNINYDWQLSSPASGVTSDNFSVRWTSNQSFNGGIYRFTVRADDGIRVFVDNNKIVDQWKDQSATTYTVDYPVTSGTHKVIVEYYESGWSAVAKVNWAQQVAQDQYFTAEYFANKTFSGTAVVRQVSSVNFDWGYGAPNNTGLPVDNFSVRFKKNVYFAAGTYRFSMTIDDDGRLFVDGKLVIDQWRDQSATTYTTDVVLTEGLHLIQMDYGEAYVKAIAKLSWIKI
jgi:hypothetical protein